MPKKTLPPGWPDPYDLLRDPEWEQNYPMLLLRAIYSIMEKAPGDLEAKYKAGFNIGVHKLTMANPPRLYPSMIKKGILNKETLTSHGKERENEVLGLRDLSTESKKRYGKKSRSEMARDTVEKMKKLRRKLATVRATTKEEGMPPTGAQP